MKTKWTLVQHSGFLVAGKFGFQRAVEPQHVSTQSEADRVLKAGGLLFDTYNGASNREQVENFPPKVKGLYPRVRGAFSRLKVDSRPIYVPVLQESHEPP